MPQRIDTHLPKGWKTPNTSQTQSTGASPAGTIHYTTCPLCEATCGLEIQVIEGQVRSIRGDKEDCLSHGHICPKGLALTEIHEDLDRVRTPMIRRGERWENATWEAAFEEIRQRVQQIRQQYGHDALGIYLGNPNVHNLDAQLYLAPLMRALGSRKRFSASTIDQMPKQLAAALLYGDGMSIPIPDVDNTSYFLILGANPMVSNGSMMTAPDMRRRLHGIMQRGGKVVVVDPVRTRTASVASEHHFIRPGTDAWFLLGILYTLIAEKLYNLGHLQDKVAGLLEIEQVAKQVSPEVAALKCGIPAETVVGIARELAMAEAAVIYGRMGTCTQAFGGVTTWLIDVLNVMTGNLDKKGGALFPLAAARLQTVGRSRLGDRARVGRYNSRVRGLPEVLGEFPVAAMAEELDTPGEGQIRGLITVAGNPVLTTPDSTRLAKALGGLEFMVSVDLYLNETTRYADVLLPVPSPLERQHYDLTFSQLAVRNVAHYSPPLFPVPQGQLEEWEVLLHLTAALNNEIYHPENPVRMDDNMVEGIVGAALTGMDEELRELLGSHIVHLLGDRRGPARMLDLLLRSGPYGDAFGRKTEGLNLGKLMTHAHGLDLGPLQPRLTDVLQTPSGLLELAPDFFLRDLERLLATAQETADPENISADPGSAAVAMAAAEPKSETFLLVGRRLLQSNNSWMHNAAKLSANLSCTLWMHPQDAGNLGLSQGGQVQVSSATGSLRVTLELTDGIMPGVVSLPHGFGHGDAQTRLSVARRQSGVNFNILSSTGEIDVATGNAVVNGIPVRVGPVIDGAGEKE